MKICEKIFKNFNEVSKLLTKPLEAKETEATICLMRVTWVPGCRGYACVITTNLVPTIFASKDRQEPNVVR